MADMAGLIKAERERRGWSQRTLAKRAGVSAPQIGLLESGKVKYGLFPHVMKVCRALGIDPDVLAFGEASDGTRPRFDFSAVHPSDRARLRLAIEGFVDTFRLAAPERRRSAPALRARRAEPLRLTSSASMTG